MSTPPEPPADDSFARVALDRRGARYSQRRLLNHISVVVAVVLVLVTLPFWLPLSRQVLTQLFPPPPYLGTYVYVGTEYGFLLALRSSDGALRWRSAVSHYDGEVEVSGGSVITVEPQTINQQPAEGVVAFSASSGQARWSAPPTQQGLRLLGTEGGTVYAVATSDAAAPNPLPTTLLAYDVASGKLRWRYQTPNFDPLGLAPPVSGHTPSLRAGTLYFTSFGGGPGLSGMLTALDLTTGKPRWQSPGGPQLGQVVAGGASLVYLEDSTTFEAVDAAIGAVRWQLSLPPQALVAVVGSLVAVGTLGGSQLWAYDATTGALRWQRGDALPIWQSSIRTAQVPADDPLLVRTYAGYAGLDAATGAMRWRGIWPFDEYVSPGGAYNPAAMDPAVGGGRYYWYDGKTAFAMTSATGAILWHRSLPAQPYGPGTYGIGPTESYVGDTLYCSDGDQIFAIDGATGKLRWSRPTGAGEVATLQVAP